MRNEQTKNITQNSVFNYNIKQKSDSQQKHRKYECFSSNLHRLSVQALCLLLILSLLATSAPAAPQSIVGAASEFAQDVRYGFLSGGWAKSLQTWFVPTSVAASSDNQNEQISSIRIFPGSITLRRGQTAFFAAIAYDAENQPLSGVDFKWTSTDRGRARQPERLRDAQFRSQIAGTFKVTAKARGREAEVTVTVVSGPTPAAAQDESKSQKTEKTDSESSSAAQNLSSPGDGGWNTGNWESADESYNLVGRTPNKNFDYGAGSSNFVFDAPIVSLPGRGIDLSLNLSYNSRLWNKSNSEITYDIDRGFPAPGWSLGFGKVMDMGDGKSMIIAPDGTRHDFDGTITHGYPSPYFNVKKYTAHTTDGTLINYESYTDINTVLDSAKAFYPDGTFVRYTARANGAVYPTNIRDANGNTITITYRNNQGPEIETVTDTLGRVVTFNYDTSNRLISVSTPRVRTAGGVRTRTLVRFHYTAKALTHSFAPGMNPVVRDNATTFNAIDAIYYPATNTGYWFNDSDSYSTYGMLAKIVEQRGMSWQASTEQQGTITGGPITKQTAYNYPLTTADGPPQGRGPGANLSDAPVYTIVTNSWNDGAGNFQSAQTTFHIDPNSAVTAPRTTITQPHPTDSTLSLITYQYVRTDGLLDKSKTVVKQQNGIVRDVSETKTTWETGHYGSSRPTRVETTDERTQMKATGYSYGSYNQVTSLREYDYGGATLLRETKTAYINNASYNGWHFKDERYYDPDDFDAGPHLFNLVDYTETWGGSNNRLSHIDYEYDNNIVVGGAPDLTDTPGVIMHSAELDPWSVEICKYETDKSDPDYINPNCSIPGHDDYNVNCDGQVGLVNVCRAQFYNWGYYRGNVTKVNAYTKVTNYELSDPVVQTSRYDKTGNVIIASRACCEQTSISFTSNTQYAYPESVTRGASVSTSPHRITTSAAYNYETGLVTLTTDANGRPSNTNYNWETLRSTSAYEPTGAYVAYIYDDAAMTVTEELREASPDGVTTGALAGKKKIYINGLGAVRREETFGANNVLDIVEVQYTKLGQVWKQSRPYRTGDAVQWSEIKYDTLGRAIETFAPDGSATKTAYNEAARPDSATTGTAGPGQTVRIQDAWGRERWMRRDALGRLVETVEPNPTGDGKVGSANTWQTKYSYDALDNLTKAEQSVQTREFAYDSLGRLTNQKLAEQTATINETGDYVGSGVAGARWSEAFFYDARSNLIRRTDARGVKTHYSYQLTGGGEDPLNRLQSVWYDLSGPRDQSQPIHGAYGVSYEYETTAGLDKTRIKRITTPGNTTEDFAYDTEGRLKDYTTTIQWRSGTPMTVSYLYDTLSRVKEMRYPAQHGVGAAERKIVQQTYDTASRLSSLSYNNQAQASELVFNAANQVTQMKVGAVGANQVTENNGYDAQTGLLANQTVQRAGTTLLNLSYDYRKNLDGTNNSKTGELRKITNNLNSNKNREYEYDQLGRLSKAKGGNNLWQQEYIYDRFGNRLYAFQSGTAANGSPMPSDGHSGLSYEWQTNRINTAGFQYDAAGNQTRAYAPDGSQWLRYEYDAAGRLVIVKNDAGTPLQSFAYGSSNARIVSVNSQTSDVTYYAWGRGQVVAEYFEPGFAGAVRWQKSYVFAGGRLLSTAANNGGNEIIEHHHSDRLGTRIVTNPATGGYFEQTTLPFGTALNGESSGATNNRYTSYDRSSLTGLDYAVNRTYDSGQNRFTQVDPIGMKATNLENPQSLNLYSYVQNDPVNYVDPSGLNAAGPGTQYGGFSHPMGVAYYVDGVLSDARTAWAILGAGAGWIDFHSMGGGLSVINHYATDRLSEQRYWVGQTVHFFDRINNFTQTQCNGIRKLLEREAKFGTRKAAAMSAVAYGSEPLMSLDSSAAGGIREASFGNKEKVDLQWWITLAGVNPIAAPPYSGRQHPGVADVSAGLTQITFMLTKSVWTAVKAVTGRKVEKFMDRAERTAAAYAGGGVPFSDVFTEEFMYSECAGTW
jgi:RHS repeat-associated protein